MRPRLLGALLVGSAGITMLACAAFSGEDGADDDVPTPPVPDAAQVGSLDGAPATTEDGAVTVYPDGGLEGGRPGPEGGGACGGRSTCRVFVTSTTWKGDELGGVEGADAKCQQTALSGNLVGTFRAWIGDGNVGPATTFVHATVPYVLAWLPDKVVASSWLDLVDGALATPINGTETGLTVLSDVVWTGLKADGTPRPEHCGGWATSVGGGRSGSTAGTSAIWSDLAPNPCTTASHLYCFEQ